ncbi:trem-like transcript 2 protein [Grammomys surdaster]|uniref:trem-like transcript 2 protein n=1 Tax=Grammomys surdaster TaxID=491861 RepID=UPI0010A027A2|nr:trem-like transcript 2 protein [Grammomys surdaster]XP_028622562.1 trem-like transcript 2 protein [Grammomys surdaster]XP_028622563.1 trem-like transcript 2 protein [Grammomys surdaster]
MPLAFLLLLLLLLSLQDCASGPSNENLYRKVRRREGETLSVQCSYKNRRNFAEAKSWCKVKKKKCDHNFIRNWVRGPSYSMRDDAKAKVVRITMEALRVQDSGRYWCMRNTAGNFYPLTGFQLEVYPALTTERNVPLTHLTDTLKDGFVTTGQVRISDSEAPFTSDMTVFTSDMTVFTSGLLALASGTTAPTPVTRYSFADTSDTITEPERSIESQPATVSPSNARPFSADPVTTSTMPRQQSSSLSTTGTCHQLTPNRSQESHKPVMLVVVSFLPVPVMLVVAYGIWKKKHMGRYNLANNYAKPWIHLPEGPETPWKPTWS